MGIHLNVSSCRTPASLANSSLVVAAPLDDGVGDASSSSIGDSDELPSAVKNDQRTSASMFTRRRAARRRQTCAHARANASRSNAACWQARH